MSYSVTLERQSPEAAAAPTYSGPLVRMEGIVKVFPGVRANDGINLEVRPGEVRALLGENGAGKTTLMRVLVGLYRMDAGKIFWKGKEAHIPSPAKAAELGIGMVHQQFSLIPTFTVAENIALGTRTNRPFLTNLDRVSRDIRELAQSHGLELDPQACVQDLAMGARQRVEIIKILYRNAELLILDEPSSVLTPQEVQDLFRVIRKLVKDGRAVVFISHKLDEVMEISDTVTVLRDGRVVGNLPTAEATPKTLSKLMVGREVVFTLEKNPLCKGSPALKVVGLHSDRTGGCKPLQGISFEVCAGEIVGIAGVAGNGQEELVQTTAGLRKCSGGSISVQGVDIANATPQQVMEAGLSYIPAERRTTGLVLEMTVQDNIILRDYNSPSFNHRGFIRNERVREFTRKLIQDYDIRAPSEVVEVETLSGGNQQKVVAARELSRQPRVILAEQPTMGLDVSATEYVRSKLLAERDRGAAILLVSAELSEVLSLSDRVLVMFGGEIVGEVIPGQVSEQEVGLLMAGKRLMPAGEAKDE